MPIRKKSKPSNFQKYGSKKTVRKRIKKRVSRSKEEYRGETFDDNPLITNYPVNFDNIEPDTGNSELNQWIENDLVPQISNELENSENNLEKYFENLKRKNKLGEDDTIDMYVGKEIDPLWGMEDGQLYRGMWSLLSEINSKYREIDEMYNEHYYDEDINTLRFKLEQLRKRPRGYLNTTYGDDPFDRLLVTQGRIRALHMLEDVPTAIEYVDTVMERINQRYREIEGKDVNWT